MVSVPYSREVLKQYFLFLIPLLGLLLLTVVTHYYSNQKLTDIRRKADETLNVELAREAIEGELGSVVSDIKFLSQLNDLQIVLENPVDPQLKILEKELLIFSKTKKRYDQIRYIALNGQDIIRINYHNGEPARVVTTKLLNKADRYYFKQTLALKPGEVFISPFDLNVEQGYIEQRYKPVIRFAIPLRNSQGRNLGILMFNVLGDTLLQHPTQTAINTGGRIHFLNNDGYWMGGPQTTDARGEHKRSFAKTYPKVWQQIRTNVSGRFETPAGLFSFNTVYTSRFTARSTNTDQTWKIVALAPPAFFKNNAAGFFVQYSPIYGALALLILFGSYVIARINVKHRKIKNHDEYERRFRKTMESVQLAALSLDEKGNVRFCNNYLLKQIGFKHEEVIDRGWVDSFVVESDKEKAKAMLADAMIGSLSSTHETCIKTRSGDTRLFFWNNTLSYDASGSVNGLTCIGEDITDKHNREEQISILSRAVEQSPNPVILTNTEGIIEYVNPKFTELTGYEATEVIGKRPSILKSGETTPDEYQDLWETIDSGKEWRGLFHNRRKNGELYWEYTAISPIRNANGEITHFLAVKEDATEQKRLEKEVKQRNQELAQAQALAVVGRMSSMIAHDLRNPLSSIKMSLQILGKRVDKQHEQSWDEEAKELGQISLDQVRYMENILADLLQFSRPDALKPEWLSVDKLLDITVSTTEKTIKEHKARIITEYQPKLPTVYGDATKLRQVFSNLILNALQATENTERIPEVRIKTRMELLGSVMKIRVEFRDNGLGIDPDNTEKLLEPFYTTKAKGTGLGLSIVKRILDQHHGDIILSRNPNGGTCVAVILPTGPVH